MTDTTRNRVIVTNSTLLRFAAGTIALIELAFSAPGLPLLANPSTLLDQGLTGWMILGNILFTPLLALIALIFAILGQLRNAVFAIGALVLAGWVNTAVAAASYGFNFEDATALDNGLTVFQTFAAPLLATLSIILAFLKRNLALAVLLASCSTLVNVLGMAIIAVTMASRGG